MPRRTYEQMVKEIDKARRLARQLGYRVAAGYLRNRDWTLEAALWLLLRASNREIA